MPRLLSFSERWAVKARCGKITGLLPAYTKDVDQLDFIQILEASLRNLNDPSLL